MKSLVKRAQRGGDDQAFVELIEENKQAMYKVAVGILKNDFDAADAIQQSILTCYEKLKELKKAQYFKTWLIRILINNCNQMLREQKKVVGIEAYYGGAEDIKGKKAEEKIAAPPGAATINEDFLELLDQMEQQYRVVLILYYVEEMSIREISQILQMNENTVKTRLSRGGRGVYKKLYLKEHPEFQFE